MRLLALFLFMTKKVTSAILFFKATAFVYINDEIWAHVLDFKLRYLVLYLPLDTTQE